jgi:hypothetical protein
VSLRSNDLRFFSRRWRMNTASCNLYPVFLDPFDPLISEWDWLLMLFMQVVEIAVNGYT